MARPGCSALLLWAAVAAASAAPAETLTGVLSEADFPLMPPSSTLPLVELAALKNMTLPPRGGKASGKARDATRRVGPVDDGVLGAQKYPFGLADPRPPQLNSGTRLAKQAASRRIIGDDNDNGMLPKNVVPTRYTIMMAPVIEKGIFYGSTDIYLNVLEATSRVILHAAEITTNEVEIFRYYPHFNNYQTYGNASIAETSPSDQQWERMVIDLDNELVPGEHYLLRFPMFASYLRNDLKGFYLSQYTDANGRTVRLATTQFEPPAARYAFPCFDEPALKARFKITIDHSVDQIARSNMPVLQVTSPSPSLMRSEFDVTVPMSTYLLAWVVSDFGKVANADGNFTTFGRANALSPRTAFLSQWVGQLALEKLKDFTGIAYTLPKVDQFAIPDFAEGAMENWGLVTYREEYLLETNKTDIRIREFIATTVCHELGHQWTGDLVTLDWWSNTWLNEAFATYFENVICDQIIPDWKLMDKYVTDNVHVGIANDVMADQVAMSSPVFSSAAIAGKFDRISYKKGGAVLRMFEHILGTDVWKKALNRYLSAYSYKNGSPARLFKAMDAEAKLAGSPLPPVSFATMATTWTEQAGVPVLTATREYTTSTVTLTQERFYFDRPEDAADDNKWWIPVPAEVTPRTWQWDWSLADAPEQSRWLSTAPLTRRLQAASTDWIVLNPKQIGYYLVNYDEDNWKMLLAALQANANDFHASVRTQLVHDALALARGGRLPYATALPFLQVLKDERDVAPWKAGIETLAFLTNRLTTTPAGNALQLFIKTITADAFQNLGFSPNVSIVLNQNDFSEDEDRYLRYYITSYACNAGNVQCAAEAVKQMDDHLTGKRMLHADVKAAAMCFGVRNSAQLFDKVLIEWSNEGNSEQQAAWAAALACTQNHQQLEKIFDDVLAKSLKKSGADLQQLITEVSKRWDNHIFLVKYFKQNWKKIHDFTDSKYTFDLLTALIGDIRTEEEFNDLNDFVKEIFQMDNSDSDSREEAQLRLQAAFKDLEWHRKYYETVSQWLFTATNSGPSVPTEPTSTSDSSVKPTSPTSPTSPTGSSTSTTGPSGPQNDSAAAASTITLLLAALLTHVML